MIDFTDRNVFVTGAASGMGKACVLQFARCGANVAMADIDEGRLREAKKEAEAYGTKVESYVLDVSDEQQVDEVLNLAWDEFGGFAVLVHAAGIVILGLLHELGREKWDRTMSVNLEGTYLVNYKMTDLMMERRYGKIINFSSIAGKIGESYNAAYSASKGGVSLFTQSLALEMAPYNIMVNAVAPGKIMTEQTAGAARWWAKRRNITPEQFIAEVADSVPVKRFGTPEEVADCVLFLGSDMSSYITGQTVTVAGGQTLI
ncbi:3-oxoacyl-[acyl-carrier-protein] reductase FabG [Lachnospiraceae bacterium]|uniref:SDR family NAD(P)-dependent oxidoreductase n=1 Tax=Extibacter sp. GGCC_0201 TaxID=2731209 RepID=UPI001AA198F1|nr:SDR family NAD(P)-dependent oxidoreductase [Extibacter sp. GGCC_0201]MBO1720415.1 SDR family oxidoreductase [Extibacter sp. GGCC_0201]BDF34517.1 3-oxoacyl-[acyl-carrier-protein] reductase FabG [Lachnospiraceae bacterium]BDF38519.1 3-oxoacyl-[acyl-carrier-protein] reductase FabG [Lachnospiraceae bacterium]